MNQQFVYVVITPARDEADRIEQTIQSMQRQTVLPLRWIIVNDGSTDGTGEIVSRYAASTSWIELINIPEREHRSFAGKAYAFNDTLAKIQSLPFQAVACMDADVTFDPDYFEFLLNKLTSEEKLGLVGTPYRELTGESYDYRFVSRDNVPGICQLFRRTCIDEIGGYLPSRGGNIDTIACLSARMAGWKTRVYPEKICNHLRTTGTAQNGALKARFNEGMRDYLIGNHPFWQLIRTAYQMTRRPLFLRGGAIGLGYFWSALRCIERPVPKKLIAYRRKEQMNILWNRLTRRSASVQ